MTPHLYVFMIRHFSYFVSLSSFKTPLHQMAKRVNVQAHPSQLELGHVDSGILLDLFPFAVILDHDVCIARAGEKIFETWLLQNPSKPPDTFIGARLVDVFKLRRPKGIRVDWKTLIQMNLVMFELELMRCGTDAPNGDRVITEPSVRNGGELQTDAAAAAAGYIIVLT